MYACALTHVHRHTHRSHQTIFFLCTTEEHTPLPHSTLGLSLPPSPLPYTPCLTSPHTPLDHRVTDINTALTGTKYKLWYLCDETPKRTARGLGGWGGDPLTPTTPSFQTKAPSEPRGGLEPSGGFSGPGCAGEVLILQTQSATHCPDGR